MKGRNLRNFSGGLCVAGRESADNPVSKYIIEESFANHEEEEPPRGRGASHNSRQKKALLKSKVKNDTQNWD